MEPMRDPLPRSGASVSWQDRRCCPEAAAGPALHLPDIEEQAMRPVLFGHLHPHPGTERDVLERLKHELTAFAEREGFCLGEIFVERADANSLAFNGLLAAVKQHEAHAAAVPTLFHLARFPGLQLAMKEHLERETGARLLVMYPSPEGQA